MTNRPSAVSAFIRQLRKLKKKYMKNPHSDLWPVHDIHNDSTEPVDCEDIDEAYRYILESENTSVYEYIHDL